MRVSLLIAVSNCERKTPFFTLFVYLNTFSARERSKHAEKETESARFPHFREPFIIIIISVLEYEKIDRFQFLFLHFFEPFKSTKGIKDGCFSFTVDNRD